MNYTQEHTSDGILIFLHGSFTFKDHHTFRAILDALKANVGGRKLLDLSGVNFLDSAALGMLLIAEDECSRVHGSLALRNPTKQISRLLELSAMDTLLTIERTGEMPGASLL